ncbi:hypothetical protein VHEMI00823 [[Torrubiella] hemipterigena]|uniref:Uncharacterized protein n=1 Tax=[Torrubiella] hemipterigena TaxID=1531966 RepID=A0A0A1T341_9HYPO|nr:hypothetical protein VHEMI00823 [[Torrubiella] hemipterigena]
MQDPALRKPRYSDVDPFARSSHKYHRASDEPNSADVHALFSHFGTKTGGWPQKIPRLHTQFCLPTSSSTF